MKAATALVLGENILSVLPGVVFASVSQLTLVTGRRRYGLTISRQGAKPLLLYIRQVLVMRASRYRPPFGSQELPQLTAANHAV